MDQTTKATRLWPFGLLNLPQGFVLVVFPFLAAKHGLSLTAIGSIVGLALMATPLKIVWTPIVDLWLSFRLWVLLSTGVTILLLAALLLLPLSPAVTAPLAFFGMAAASVSGIAGSGMMALTVEPARIGRASGFWQGGTLLAQGIGGGVMLWAATNLGVWPALAVGALFASGGFAVLQVPEPHRDHLGQALGPRIATIGRDLWQLAARRRGLYVVIICATPIGVGAASSIWGGFAHEWGAGPAIVALTTGLGFGLASTLGSFLFGFFADRMDRVKSFLLTGLMLIGAGVLLALSSRTPYAFAAGTLFYGLLLGCAYTAFTALTFAVADKGAAASKVGLLNAIGNMPNSYMPPLLGLVHDRASSGAMFWFEALFTLAFVILFALLRIVMWARPAPIVEPVFA